MAHDQAYPEVQSVVWAWWPRRSLKEQQRNKGNSRQRGIVTARQTHLTAKTQSAAEVREEQTGKQRLAHQSVCRGARLTG